MKKQENTISARKQLLALAQMSAEQLAAKWVELFGREPPKYGRVFMRKRLAYRIQEIYSGGLSPALKNQLLEQKGVALRSRGVLKPGTRIIREWHNEKHEIIIRNDGIEYKGKIYRSLTGVANAITGTHWNGREFFGV